MGTHPLAEYCVMEEASSFLSHNKIHCLLKCGGGEMYGYAPYIDVTAIYMSTVATVAHLFSQGATVGCDLVHLSYALIFSLGHFSIGYRADYWRYSHSSISIHTYSRFPLSLGNYIALWGPITEEQPALICASQNA